MKICFTGHRAKALCGYRRESYHAFVYELKNLILQLYATQSATVFYSGGAQGFDQLAFWAVAHAKLEHPEIQNNLILPDQFFHMRWPENSCFGQHDFAIMCRYADSIQYAAPKNTTGVRYLFVRNHMLVDQSDAVIGLYTGTDDWKNSLTKGGTAECLRYAWNTGKRVMLLNTEKTDRLCLTGVSLVQPQWP